MPVKRYQQKTRILGLRTLGLYLAFLVTIPAWGQSEVDIESKMEDYLARSPREKLFLHLSKTTYLTGETIWFKVYHYNEKDHSPFAFSKVVYIDLINKESEIVSKQKIRIDKKGGDGWIYLPTDMNSGQYEIRAYTLWMRNFDESFFFSQTISIINPFKRLNLQEEEKNPVHIEFFPEGGHLVEGRANVAFKAMDKHGNGIDFTGFLVNEENDTLVKFQPNAFGMGSFHVTLTAGQQIRAFTSVNGQISEQAFPKIEREGYGLVATTQNGIVRTWVRSSSASKKVYLAVISRDKFLFIKSGTISTNGPTWEFPELELNEGINQLTVFDENGIPVCERLMFRYPEEKLTLHIDMEESSMANRESVRINLKSLVDEKAIVADLSISVFKSDQSDAIQDFESFMWLTSELKGHVQSPSYYFRSRSDKTRADVDYLLLTQGWRIYDYTGIKPEHTYLPEFIDQTIQGVIVNTETNEPVVGENVYFSFPNTYAQMFVTKSSERGEILFETKELYGISDAYLRTKSMDSTQVDIQLEDPFHDAGMPVLPVFDPNPNDSQQIIDESGNMQIGNIFAQRTENFHVADTSSFYQQPSSVYYLDDYTRFPVMEEVMREYIYGVFVRKEEGKFVFKVIDVSRNELMEESPLVLLDGVPVFDLEAIMSMDPLHIKRIELIQSRYYYGQINLSGIVAFYSYKTDLPQFPLSERAIKHNYQGYQKSRNFYSPEYATDSAQMSRYPDFRNQLFWEPAVSTDENGSASVHFFTSDAEGKYTIQVQGLGQNGLPGSAEKSFEVHKTKRDD